MRREFCQQERTSVNGELRGNPTSISLLVRLFLDSANCRHKSPRRRKSPAGSGKETKRFGPRLLSQRLPVSQCPKWECLQNSLYRSNESFGNKCWFCNFSAPALPPPSKSGRHSVSPRSSFGGLRSSNFYRNLESCKDSRKAQGALTGISLLLGHDALSS